MQYRHGDLLIEKISSIPTGAKKKNDGILAYGEATGHAHRLNGGVVLVEENGNTYIRVMDKPVTITHEEHNAIALPVGDYQVIRQREYDPYEQAIRQVAD